MSTQEFGIALHEALLVKRMSQAELARAIPTDASQVTRWITGAAKPSMRNQRRIEEILETKLPNASTITREYELFVAAPVGGLNPDNIDKHHADVAKVLVAARKQVNGIYWPSEGDRTASDRTDVSAIRTERNLRALNECSALLYLQFSEVVNPSSAYIELGYALGRKMKLTIMVKSGLMLPYMLHEFGAVGPGLRFLPQVRIYPNIASAEEAAERIARNGRELLGLT